MEYQGNDIEGWMTYDELHWLYEQAKGKKSIVEIGSWKGRSTHALLSGCVDGQVWAIDHFKGNPGDDCEQEAKNEDINLAFRTNLAGFVNYSLLVGNSVEISQRFADASVDMVFIDATHTYDAVSADLRAWLPKAKKIICGHDYDWAHAGVTHAVNEMFGLRNVRTIGTIWYVNLEEK